MVECKFTSEVAKMIYKNLRNGAIFETASQAVGITRQTLHNWIERGEKGEEPFLLFLQTIKEVRADVELELIEIVKDATKKDYNAAKWLLSHMNNEAWGDKSEQKIEHSQKEPLKINFVVDNGKDNNGNKVDAMVKPVKQEDKPVSGGSGQQ